MSQTETHYGKLRRVETSLTAENWCKNQCILAGITELSSYHDSWEEEFRDSFHEKYFIVNGQIWEVFDHIETEDGDIDIMIPNLDKTITFVQQFYNGGTCLSEVIENGLADLQKKNMI